MLRLGMKIEYYHRTQFLLAPTLLKLENIYSRGLAITEQSIKQNTLCRAVNDSFTYFIYILYGTIFLR